MSHLVCRGPRALRAALVSPKMGDASPERWSPLKRGKVPKIRCVSKLETTKLLVSYQKIGKFEWFWGCHLILRHAPCEKKNFTFGFS